MPVSMVGGRLIDSTRSAFIGLDTLSSLTEMPEGSLRILDNGNVRENGVVSKRDGYTNILTGSVWTGRSIRAGLEVEVTGGTKKVLVYGENGSNGIFGEATTSVSTILGSLSTERPCLLAINGLTYFLNATDNFIYDGTATRAPGIEPPSSAPTLASTANGSLTVGASYIVGYTYYNEDTRAESSMSPLSSPLVIAADPNDGITVTYTDGSSSNATHVRFYRTVANGTVLLFDKAVPLGSTSTTLTQSDAGLGDQAEVDNTTLATWGLCKYGEVINNRVHVTGFVDGNENRVRFSKIGRSGSMPESFEAPHFYDCISSKGLADKNIGVGKAGDTPIILKTKSIGRADQLGTVPGDLGSDIILMEYKELAADMENVSHFASANILGFYVWLAKDNIYATDGSIVLPIATQISNLFSGFNWQYPDECSIGHDANNKRIYVSVLETAASTASDLILVGSYRFVPGQALPIFAWSQYRPGREDGVTYPGLKAGCFFSTTQSTGRSEIHFGNNLANGKIYKMNSGGTDDGDDIAFQMLGRPVSFGISHTWKDFGKDVYFISGAVAIDSVLAGSAYNLSEFAEDIEVVDIDTNGARFDIDLFDVGVFATSEATRAVHAYRRKCDYAAPYIKNFSGDEELVIHGYNVTALPNGGFK